MLPHAMNKSLLLASALCVFAACKGNTYRVNVGPMFAIANGDVALQEGAGGLSLGANQNDVDSEIGAGDTQAAPYARVEIDHDKHRFRAHGFGMDSNSTGTLLGAYGDIPAGTSVTTSLEFYAIAANWSYQLLRSQAYRVGAGAQLGYYSLDVAARSNVAREEVVTDVLVPMPFVEVEGYLGPLTVGANASFMSADLGDGSGIYWDAELYARLQATKNFELLAGYRYLTIDAYGEATGRDFDADVNVQGIFLTAGIKF